MAQKDEMSIDKKHRHLWVLIYIYKNICTTLLTVLLNREEKEEMHSEESAHSLWVGV